MSKRLAHIGSIAVIIAAFLWSLDGLLRRSLYDLPPATVVFWEHLLGLAIIGPIALYHWRKFMNLTQRQWLTIALVAMLSGAAGTIMYTAALGQVQYIQFSVVVLLQQLSPVFAIAASAILLRERISRRFIASAAIALVGAYMTAFPDLTVNLETGSGTVIAALLAAGAAAAWGTGTALSKYALRDTSFIHIVTLRFALTPLFALGYLALTSSVGSIAQLSGNDFATIVAIVFSTGLLALVIYYFGLQRIPASRSALLELVFPLSAVIIGWLFLSQNLTITQAIGGLLLAATAFYTVRTTTEKEPKVQY